MILKYKIKYHKSENLTNIFILLKWFKEIKYSKYHLNIIPINFLTSHRYQNYNV